MEAELEAPKIEMRLLDPIDRISEVLFGLIMALTFTCTISVMDTEREDVKELLIGAIGCNIAWGFVDAVMYLLMTITEKGRGLTVFNFVRKTTDIKKSYQFIADALPPIFASQMNTDELETFRQKIINMTDSPKNSHLTLNDFKIATGIFILVFLSTFPIAIPFVLISDLQTALRTSNGVAIVMMFLCGWLLAKYAGRNRLLMGIVFSLIGIALVLITIALGG